MNKLKERIKTYWNLFLKSKNTRERETYGREHRRLLRVYQTQLLMVR